MSNLEDLIYREKEKVCISMSLFWISDGWYQGKLPVHDCGDETVTKFDLLFWPPFFPLEEDVNNHYQPFFCLFLQFLLAIKLKILSETFFRCIFNKNNFTFSKNLLQSCPWKQLLGQYSASFQMCPLLGLHWYVDIHPYFLHRFWFVM